MVSQNLKDARQPKAARMALGGSILYTGLTLYLISHFSLALFIPWLSWLASLVGGLGLEAYGKRFISDWQMLPVKSNFKPLVICLGIIGLLFALTFIVSKPGLR